MKQKTSEEKLEEMFRLIFGHFPAQKTDMRDTFRLVFGSYASI